MYRFISAASVAVWPFTVVFMESREKCQREETLNPEYRWSKTLIMAAGSDWLSKIESLAFPVSPGSVLLQSSILYSVFTEKLKTSPEKDED